MTRTLLLLWALATALHPGGSLGSPTLAEPAARHPRTDARAHRRRGVDGIDGAAEMRRILLKHGLPLPPDFAPNHANPQPERRWAAAEDPSDEEAEVDADGGDAPQPAQAVQGAQAAGLYGSARAVSDSNDVEYLVDMQVGGTLMKLDLDTGSSDLYVSPPSP